MSAPTGRLARLIDFLAAWDGPLWYTPIHAHEWAEVRAALELAGADYAVVPAGPPPHLWDVYATARPPGPDEHVRPDSGPNASLVLLRWHWGRAEAAVTLSERWAAEVLAPSPPQPPGPGSSYHLSRQFYELALAAEGRGGQG